MLTLSSGICNVAFASNSNNILEFKDRYKRTNFLQEDIAQLNVNKDTDLFCENGEHFDTRILDHYVFTYKSDSSKELFAYEVCVKCDEIFYEERVAEYHYTLDIYVNELEESVPIYIMCVEPMTQQEIEESALDCINLYLAKSK